MQFLNTWMPLSTSVVAFVFAVLVFLRWRRRRHTHLLIWGIGLLMYGIGAAMEGLYALLGWNELVFKVWYLFGAVLVAAWLGQGTAYLLLRGKRRRIADVLFVILLIGSLYATFKVFTAQLDPAQMLHGELSGHAIISGGVRGLTPFFNLYGVILLAGGAIYSAWLFYRKRVLLNRVVGNICIAAGALLPGFGGALQRAGVPAALYLSEFLGLILIFAGFLLATQVIPMPATAQQRGEATA